MRTAFIFAAAALIGTTAIGSDVWASKTNKDGKRQRTAVNKISEQNKAPEIAVLKARSPLLNRYTPRLARYGRKHTTVRPVCIPHRRIERRLRRHHGWDIVGIKWRARGFFVAKAVRPSGKLFQIKVDNCYGHVINAKRIKRHHYGILYKIRRYF